jgi:hypothetical protein
VGLLLEYYLKQGEYHAAGTLSEGVLQWCDLLALRSRPQLRGLLDFLEEAQQSQEHFVPTSSLNSCRAVADGEPARPVQQPSWLMRWLTGSS